MNKKFWFHIFIDTFMEICSLFSYPPMSWASTGDFPCADKQYFPFHDSTADIPSSTYWPLRHWFHVLVGQMLMSTVLPAIKFVWWKDRVLPPVESVWWQDKRSGIIYPFRRCRINFVHIMCHHCGLIHDRLLTRFRGADHTQPPVGHQVMEFWVDLG